MNEKDILRYPCCYCGECALWLAYTDIEEVLTFPQLLNKCYDCCCPIVDKEVTLNDVLR